MKASVLFLNLIIFGLAAVGAFAVWGAFVGTYVTYELDTGQLVSFWGDAEFCRNTRDALEDGASGETTSPWGLKASVRHVWCNGSGTD